MKRGWRKVQCSSCCGTGMESDYGGTGEDFYGAKDCGSCWGQGGIWLSPKGALALYPGGPFVGRMAPQSGKLSERSDENAL